MLTSQIIKKGQIQKAEIKKGVPFKSASALFEDQQFVLKVDYSFLSFQNYKIKANQEQHTFTYSFFSFRRQRHPKCPVFFYNTDNRDMMADHKYISQTKYSISHSGDKRHSDVILIGPKEDPQMVIRQKSLNGKPNSGDFYALIKCPGDYIFSFEVGETVSGSNV